MSRLAISAQLIVILLISACANVSPKYGVSADNVEKLRELSAHGTTRLAVAQFSSFDPTLKSITCRGVVPIEPSDGQTFEGYIQNALTTELKLAGIYAPESPVKLQAKLENINFDSAIGAGKWVIDLSLSAEGTPPFQVNSIYRFSTNWIGDVACQQVATALPAATQDLISRIVAHPAFMAIVKQNSSR